MATTDRRVVSVLFADLAGFTALSERLDAEEVAGIQDSWFTLVSQVVADHGGQVEKYIGDAVMVTFGTVDADDTDPVRAVRAGRHLVTETGRLGRDLALAAGTLRVRVGVNTGEVVVTRNGSGWRVTGDTVNTAARLQTAAEPDEVLLGAETAFGVAHSFVLTSRGAIPLKGKAAPVPAWRVVDQRPEPRRGLVLHGLRAPTLGRADELADLVRVLDAARDREPPSAVLVLAPPGVGKSRLVEELCATALAPGQPCWTVRLGDEPDKGYPAVARLLRHAGVVPPDGVGDGAAALLAALEARGYDAAHARVSAEHTTALVEGGELAAEPVDLYAAWTAALDATAAPVPIWVIEDFHLAGPDLRAFVRHALDHPRPEGRLIVLTARPTAGLTSASAQLAGVPVLHLEPLSSTTTRELVHALVGRDAVPASYVDGIVSAAGGNPLFVEELLRSWIQSGVLVPGPDGGWRCTAGSWAPTLPSTVHAIYQGQLDALPAGSRTLVERGSVPGTTFPVDALPALGVPAPDAALDVLTEVGLLFGPHEHAVSPRAYTYRHTLLRDAAYGSLARRDRAELHVRFARWLQDEHPDHAGADAELVGGHLALAVEVLPATASTLEDGTSTAEVADEAADLLERAARQHLVSSPQRSALLLRRALDLPTAGQGARRLRRHLALAEAERRSNRLEEAMSAFAAAGEAARLREDSDSLLAAALGYESALFASRLPRTTWGEVSVRLLRAAEAALPVEDVTARSRALAALGRALLYGGDEADGAEACRRAVELAELSGDPAALAEALLARRPALSDPSQLAARLVDADRVAEAAAVTDDVELQLEASRLHLIDLLGAGDVAAAERVEGQAAALVERLGRPLFFWYPPMWRAMRALRQGRYGDADRLVEEFRAEGRRAHYSAVDEVWAIQRIRLHLDTGQVEAVRGVVLDMCARHGAKWAFAAAGVLARTGERDRAQEQLDLAVADDFAAMARDLSWASGLAHLAEAAAALADRSVAARVGPLLEPWIGQAVVLGSGALCLGDAVHHVGLCRRTVGDLDGAREALEQAVVANDALGARGLAARSRAELARTLALTGDVDRARTLARTAHDAAATLGMVDLARDLQAELLDDIADPHPRPGGLR